MEFIYDKLMNLLPEPSYMPPTFPSWSFLIDPVNVLLAPLLASTQRILI